MKTCNCKPENGEVCSECVTEVIFSLVRQRDALAKRVDVLEDFLAKLDPMRYHDNAWIDAEDEAAVKLIAIVNEARRLLAESANKIGV